FPSPGDPGTKEAIPMSAEPGPAGSATPPLDERLERGEIVFFPVCPFPLPQGDDHRFLLGQRLAGRSHKNISYDPATGRAGGFRTKSAAEARRLRDLLAAFADS